MINLKALKLNLENELPLWVIRAKIDCFQSGLVSEKITRDLTNMGFDPDYTYPYETKAKDIIVSLLSMNATIYFETYVQNYFKWRIFPVNAHVLNSKPNLINFNSRQFTKNYSQSEREETIWHELIHVVDSFDKKRIFWHGKDNNLKGKDETAPVKLAKYLASTQLIKEGDSWKLT